MITLSEAYRKLNNKNTRRRVNEAVESDIPAQFRKYYKISDYEPSGGEYEVGDRVGEFEIAAYLEPKAQYDRIEIWPFLLKSKDGYMVAEVAWDRVYPVNIDEVTMYLDESTRRLARRRRVNEAMQSDIPAPFKKYFKISNYEPDDGEYQIGERVDDYEIAAYLEPKDQYDGIIEMFPFLLKGKEGFIVGDVSWDRVYYIDADAFVEEVTNDYREYMRLRKNQGKNDKVGSLKYESRRRNTRRRRVNESLNEDREIRDAVESKFMDFFETLTKELTAEHHTVEGKPIVFDVGSFTTTYLPYFMDYLNASLNQVYKKNNVTPLYNKRYM
jgi:hypothetical protein